MTYSDLSTYEGMWRDDKREGQGVMTWQVREGNCTYEGDFLDDLKHG